MTVEQTLADLVAIAGARPHDLEALRAEASANPEAFWARMAAELHWFKKWDTVLKWTPPHAEWFGGGKINVSYNCLDRHVEVGWEDRDQGGDAPGAARPARPWPAVASPPEAIRTPTSPR